VCDDGNAANDGACNAGCSALTFCGDATVQNPNGANQTEACDDGNTDNTDACLNSCVTVLCGDGFVRAGAEACDDGNTVSGDGCSATCQVEQPACVEPAVKITFSKIEVVNAPTWKNQIFSDGNSFPLTGNYVVIPLSQVQPFKSSLRDAFQVGWEGSGQEKHLRLGSMIQTKQNKNLKTNYGVELDYTVEFLGDVHMTRFIKMNLETGKETIVFNDGKIVYLGDQTDGRHFVTGNGPGDDWSKYYLTYKECGKDQRDKDQREKERK
jgi:cysteine-rich repeat protein